MELFNLLGGIVLMMLAFQMNQTWLAVIIAFVVIVTIQSITGAILALLALGLLFVFSASYGFNALSLPLMGAITLIAIVYALREKPQTGGGLEDLYGMGGMGGPEGGGGGMFG